MSLEELHQLAARVKEQMIFRMRKNYGACDEFEQWVDALDLFDKYPRNEEAQDFAQEAFHALIRTKHPEFRG